MTMAVLKNEICPIRFYLLRWTVTCFCDFGQLFRQELPPGKPIDGLRYQRLEVTLHGGRDCQSGHYLNGRYIPSNQSISYGTGRAGRGLTATAMPFALLDGASRWGKCPFS